MPGRLDQARTRFNGVMRRQMWQLAGIVAEGTRVTVAGRMLNLTAGQTARVWANVKAELGRQAR